MSIAFVAGGTPPNEYVGDMSFNPLTGPFVIGVVRDTGGGTDASLTYDGVAMTAIGTIATELFTSAWDLYAGYRDGMATGAKTLSPVNASPRTFVAASFSGVGSVGSPSNVNRNGGGQPYLEKAFGVLPAGQVAVLAFALTTGSNVTATITGGSTAVNWAGGDGGLGMGIAYAISDGSTAITLRAENPTWNYGSGKAFVLLPAEEEEEGGLTDGLSFPLTYPL
jgi:hypothetical protein